MDYSFPVNGGQLFDEYTSSEKSAKFTSLSFDELYMYSLPSKGGCYYPPSSEKQNDNEFRSSRIRDDYDDYDSDDYEYSRSSDEDIDESKYVFSSYDGSKTITLSKRQLNEYPDCLFNTIILLDLDGDKLEDGSYKTSLSPKTLESVKYFFDNG